MRTTLLMALCVAFAATCLAAPQGPPAVKWAMKFEAAQSAAAKSAKPILLLLYANRVSVCASGPLPQDPFKGAKVIELSAKFECVRVDADKHADLAAKYKKVDFPIALFLTPEGELFYDTMADLDPEAFLIKMNAALEALKALPERRSLEAARKAGSATPEQLAALGHLLLLANRDVDAATVLAEALAALPTDAALRPQAELDQLIAGATKGATARTALVEWIAASADSPRRWEAEHKLALAQQCSNARESAVQTHTTVAKGSPDSDWGRLSKFYAKALTAQIDFEVNPPRG